MKQYCIGLDFGTLSCRGVLMDAGNGAIAASAECAYRHGVIEHEMHHKVIPLPDDWYLQDPEDWLESMSSVISSLLEQAGIAGGQVLSIGTDFTSCTLIPTDALGEPLCLKPEFRDEPHAWPKLWKHHGAQEYAEEIEAVARERTTWLKDYFGNSVSCEWAFPKMLQIAREAPEIYRAADRFIEAVDWIVMTLTGRLIRNAGILGVNEFYVGGSGYPDAEFCAALDPLMADVTTTKLAGDIGVAGQRAGTLLPEMAKRLGLSERTVVAVGHSDSAVAGCGAGITESGSMMMVMGTSTCHNMMHRDRRPVEGICSVAADGMIPGLYGYESGQSATGDVFAWFAENMTPREYYDAAEEKGVSVLTYLGQLAERAEPGESGLLALDWLSGNRSVLSNYDLSGMIVGLTLQSKCEEVFRALVEANVFGSRRIIDSYDLGGVRVEKIYAVGGIPKKSPWIMQMCADVLGREIYVPQADNVLAIGSAVCGAVAAGESAGCRDFADATRRFFADKPLVYKPDAKRTKQYDELYALYLGLHDTFGRNMDIMKKLRSIKKQRVI